MKPKLFFFTALVFACTYLLGIFATAQMAFVAPVLVRTAQEANLSLVLFLFLFFSATAFFLLLFYVTKRGSVYRVVFALLIALGLIKLFELVFPLGFSSVLAIIFLIGFFLVPAVWTHDLIVVLVSAGIAPVLSGQFSEHTAVLLLIILSVYDVIAVFVTRHMMTLAHEMIRHQASFALFIPERVRDFGANIASVVPGSGFLIVGGGDIILPLIALSTVARTSMTAALYGMVGTLVGLFINHLFLTLSRRPLPALPLLTVGTLIGIQIGYLFT
ncbi:MAG: presenilin family intramembrane aspartyl protease [Candidatus Uhrbacteria bacterium]|nr:presenilin family intramembrane aspartyl protease [Candidatus Uhrbacteria bacterium]